MNTKVKLSNVIFGCMITLLAGLASLYISGGKFDFNKIEDKRIYEWTAKQFKVNQLEMPKVNYLSDKEMKEEITLRYAHMIYKFIEDSKKNGIEKEEIMKDIEDYIFGVKGMYAPWNDVIMIRNTMSRCIQKATLSHEFTHHFQNMYGYKIEEETPGMIKELYKKEFCN